MSGSNQIPQVGSQDHPDHCKSQQKRPSNLIFSLDEVPELPKIGGRYERNEDLLNVFKQKVLMLKKDVSDGSE